MAGEKEESIENIDETNNKVYLKFTQRYWQYDKPSQEIIRERIENPIFDPEFIRVLKGSPDQRMRWDIDFTEPSLQGFFEGKDEAFSMFKRKFQNALSACSRKYGVDIKYSNFMENKVVFKKNETKLKKVLEIIYFEEKGLYYADREIRSSSNHSEKEISDFIVKAFEEIGTYKKPFKKLQLVLSLNMVDWLLASTASGTVSSCLNLEGGHRYWSGLGFLAGDANRAMIYICDGQKKTFEGMITDNCITRSWVILTANNSKSITRWYSQDILPVEAIRAITGDNSWRKGMDAPGKNLITPTFLESGMTTTIYVDEGCWEKNGDKFQHTLTTKGCYQIFTEDLNPAKGFEWKTPWNNGSNEWRISMFKRTGTAINDHVPVAICAKCGRKKSYVRSSGMDEPICFSCFNKDFFTCDSCGSYHDIKKPFYDGFAIKDNTKSKVKLCKSCETKIKKCVCCGLPVISGGAKTVEGETICNSCANDSNNKYKKCSVCGKISKEKVTRVFDPSKNHMTELCSEHMITEKSDIEKNSSSFVPLTRKPVSKFAFCKKCGAKIPYSMLFYGVCLSCKEDIGENNSLEF